MKKIKNSKADFPKAKVTTRPRTSAKKGDSMEDKKDTMMKGKKSNC